MHAGGVQGTLVICVRSDPKQRIIFTKYIEGESIGFRATIPRESWIDAYLSRLKAELDRRSVPYLESRLLHEPPMTFNLGTDFGGAYVVTCLLFNEVMGVHLHRDCVAYFHDTLIDNTPRLTGVDAPDELWF